LDSGNLYFMNTRAEKVRQALLGLVLVHVSLIAALTARFLIVYFFKKIGAGPSYQEFVHYSLLGYRNASLPMIVIGCSVLYFRSKWVAYFHRNKSHWEQIASLSLFYGLMALAGAVLGRDFTFPRQTWLVAWCFSVGVCYAIATVRGLDDGVRDRLVYNRFWHLLIDSAVVVTAFLASYIFRFDGFPPTAYQHQLLLILPYMVFLYMGINLCWRVYSLVWRFTGLREGLVLLLSTASSGLVALTVRILFLQQYTPLHVPFGIMLAQPPLTFIGFLTTRMTRRIQYNYLIRNKSEGSGPSKERRVLLVGAGNAGLMLARELESHRNFKIVGFLDDDRRKQGTVISGIRVLGTTRDVSLVVRDRNVHEVIISMPTAPRSVIQRIVLDCSGLNVATSTVPSLSEIILGKVKIGQLRPVRMEDLLGRASVVFDTSDRELFDAYGGRQILVTGAAGSIGSELVRQLTEFKPRSILLADKDENGLYEIGLEVRDYFQGELIEILTDVRDRARLEKMFQKWKPEAVFHAAAYKHVPMMEYYPSESVFTNVRGTKNVLELADEFGAQSFLLISTDKAVNPTSVMGASKRVGEMLVRFRALHGNGKMRLCCVRFGNVLGSRGSVVPLFQKRIAEGKNIQVTHPDMKRYFMTIPEAVQLVIQAGSLGRQGETFVLDMGNPVKILDLAKDLIEQSGLVPGKDIQIEISGLRPGEKLFEELMLSADSGAKHTKYPKILVDRAIDYDWELLDRAIKGLEEAALADDVESILRIFESLNIGYRRRTFSLSPSASAHRS